jgi:hypothetical protein
MVKKDLYHAGLDKSSDTPNATKNPKMAIFKQGKPNMFRSVTKSVKL